MQRIGLRTGKIYDNGEWERPMLQFIGLVSSNQEDKEEMDINSPYTSIRRTKMMLTVG